MAATVHHAPRARRPGRLLARLLVPLMLLGVCAVVVIIVRSPPQFLRAAPTHVSRHAPARRLPPYWTVRPGDSLGLIAAKTGLSVDLLEAYNPTVNPNALTPGQRLNLWRYLGAVESSAEAGTCAAGRSSAPAPVTTVGTPPAVKTAGSPPGVRPPSARRSTPA